ncbi:glycoside hydrolase family 3 protein [Polaribacter haliotis]|uniref:beta-N-acetylhexosaminidase n=1 Tax=Polaribacter haliotis TaxID=1888915 RepID=A0A7L8AIZ7_9FLAO|nr:glycoside hydrolase family 3 N-terminal domain-containing protein [Polaribacter haliotis]QOD61972.1 glycoside hydrolase family 3 protein [Polaribacter haliotis]
MKTYISVFLIIVTFCVTIISCNKPKENQLPEAISYNFTPKDTTWKSLSIREKIGQTMIVRAFHKAQVAEFGSIENMMEKYPIGGIFVPYWDYLFTPPRDQVIPTIKNAISDYENASKYPMIVTEDFERGVGSIYSEFTNMPSEMAVGAANNTDLAYKFGNAIAKESNALGVNWLLHPLVDLNMNPLQSLVIERAISDDATRAYPLLKAQIEGMNAQGVVSTIKHFPGDGATIKNQHLITSANNLSISEWNKTFGTMYQKMINEGTPAIMVGHIRFPAYQKEKRNGIFLPASLSEELMVGLLKKKMKFNGIIMSDALNMGGAAGYYDNEIETSLAAFKAGVDMVLWPTLKFMDSLEVRIKRGDIPMSRLNDAVERIWGVREQYNLLKKKGNIFYAITPEETTKIQKDAQEIANSAVTLLTDATKIPLKTSENKKIIIVNISHEDRTNDLRYTQSLLQAKGFEVDTILHNPNFLDWGEKLNFFDKYDKVLVAFENRYFSPLGASLLKDKEALGVWTMGMLPQDKIIAVSYSNPYYVNYYFENAFIGINAYSLDLFSQKAVVETLTGGISFKGTSPVKLEHDMLK